METLEIIIAHERLSLTQKVPGVRLWALGVKPSALRFTPSALRLLPSAFGFKLWALGFILTFISISAFSQEVTIHGTVFNMYKTRPLDGVSVISNTGRGTTTDSNGNYMIRLNERDSLRFSYLGRMTQMFPVTMMNSTTGFDIALHVNPTELREVRVAPKNYRFDSLQNRQDYAKIFNYKKPGIELTDGSSGTGVGIDLDAIINMFAFKKKQADAGLPATTSGG